MADYEIGYGKPPAKTRFKEGQSGNPKGRPKGTLNLKTDIAEELGAPVRILEGGRTRQISMQRAVVKRLMTKAANGELRAIEKLLELKLRLLPEDMPDADAPLTGDEAEILAQHAEEILRRGTAAAPIPKTDSAAPAIIDAKKSKS
jgi:hypothetical protein